MFQNRIQHIKPLKPKVPDQYPPSIIHSFHWYVVFFPVFNSKAHVLYMPDMKLILNIFRTGIPVT